MELFISAISQGLVWGILPLGLFISFRILNIADMTTEGAFPLGAAVAVTCIHLGMHPVLATICAFISGMIAGLITGFLMTVCKIPSLLAGILTMTALLSINLRIMGKPNQSFLQKETVMNAFHYLSLPKYYDVIFLGGMIVAILIALLYFFFQTELGQGLIATGDNEKMAISLGISTKKMMILGLMISNGVVAFSGAIISQYHGYADVNSGLGTIVIALAAIIIGEVIFGEVSFLERLVCIVYGSIIYRLMVLLVLQMDWLEATDFKLLSACIIALSLMMPEFQKLRQSLSLKKGAAS